VPEVIKQWFIKHMPVEEDIGLHENKAFIRWIGYPLLAIFVMVIAVTWNLFESGVYSFNKEFEISFVTLNDFAKYYAFPIASLTVPLTFGVLFNRFHSSKQKAKSNRLVEQNNSANNFFNHCKYFSEHCEKIQTRFKWLEVKIAPEILYRNLFPKSSVTNFTTDIEMTFIDEYIIKLEDAIDSFNFQLQNTGTEEVEQTSNRGTSAELSTETSTLIESYLSKFNFKGIVFDRKIETEEEFIDCCRNQFDLIFMIFCFNGASNLTEVSNYLSQKFTSTIQNKLKSGYKIV